MTANMDTVGTFAMYNELVNQKIITCFHKHYEVDEYPLDLDPNYYMISTGITDSDWDKIQILIKNLILILFA